MRKNLRTADGYIVAWDGYQEAMVRARRCSTRWGQRRALVWCVERNWVTLAEAAQILLELDDDRAARKARRNEARRLLR